MSLEAVVPNRYCHNHTTISSRIPSILSCNAFPISIIRTPIVVVERPRLSKRMQLMVTVPPLTSSSTTSSTRLPASAAALSNSFPAPLDLTEDNVRNVLVEARGELAQIFDSSVGITGKVELVELDGPFVKISLKGRFWHKRSTVLARVGNYLKQRIPEILEVEIENEKQLDDSPQNF
uniref:NIF system FeS cluster assembly NifU C-terminal domain-containing protein n=1 Tax=Fagus sylvatica TaxID=28930 RepID=A0A2N9ILT9_FAGSY